MSSWIAAATSYSNNGVTMIPFYIYYSMFGFQRVGDLAWAAGDMQARGFLLGGTAGRTTLAGEGLQHQDGHSHLQAAFIPNCRAYDPAFGYELAVILHDGMKKMYEEQQNVFYYVTVMNENYHQPAMPDDVADGIIKGMYLYRQGSRKKKRVQLMGSGTILREVIAAAALLEDEWNIAADVWSITSFTELRREAMDVERWNMLHPMDKQRVPFVSRTLEKHKGPVVAATDYICSFPEQIAQYVGDRHFVSLGTDGYGRSDMRSQLRKFFEVNRHYVVVAALKALADSGEVDSSLVAQAIKAYKIDTDKPNPATV
jgi:pyruvate dehydrogenase E1 component